jgi:integrase/recombinase XerD
MTTQQDAVGLAKQYDRALRKGRYCKLPPDYPRPRPTAEWPPENIALLAEYCNWLLTGGASDEVIHHNYLPIAGHVLGLNLKPHPQLDLETDLQPAMDFIEAKGASASWSKICRNSMLKFRRFLCHQRGRIEINVTPYDHERHTQGLPDWLVHELSRYQHVQQRNWRTARLEDGIRRFWGTHLRLWRFLCEQCAVKEIKDLKRQYLLDFIDQRLTAGYAVSGINADLRYFRTFLLFLQEQDYAIPQSLLRMPTLKQPDPLPKFLTDEQVLLLRDDLNRRVAQALNIHQRRDAVLDRALFYLLWQSGMRLGEVEELRLEDLDLAGRKLIVRQSKGLKDRTVFMTDAAVHAVRDYLDMRGPGPTDHIFLYRNQPLCKDLARSRIRAAGERTGVKAHPHRLRHTAATQLLNAGCRITSIQKFLGHKDIGSTMTYARVHDHTVANDYYRAMEQVERRLELLGAPKLTREPISENERDQLLTLTEQLFALEMSAAARMEIASQMYYELVGREIAWEDPPIDDNGRKQWNHPPPSPVLLGVS